MDKTWDRKFRSRRSLAVVAGMKKRMTTQNRQNFSTLLFTGLFNLMFTKSATREDNTLTVTVSLCPLNVWIKVRVPASHTCINLFTSPVA